MSEMFEITNLIDDATAGHDLSEAHAGLSGVDSPCSLPVRTSWWISSLHTMYAARFANEVESLTSLHWLDGVASSCHYRFLV